MDYLYTYKVVRENLNGEQGKRKKIYYTYEPLNVGGIYAHLGCGFPGLHRVLECVKKEKVED